MPSQPKRPPSSSRLDEQWGVGYQVLADALLVQVVHFASDRAGRVVVDHSFNPDEAASGRHTRI